MKRIAVFCGANPGNNPDYVDIARELGQILAAQALGLVYGGGYVGIMGQIANSVLEAGGEVIGVIPHHLMALELAHPDVADMRVVGSMHERKALMAELADGFIAMPGGYGTIEEIFEVLTWAQIGLHNKPCGFLNVNGFYDRLLDFLDHVMVEDFIAEPHRTMIVVETDPAHMLDQFITYRPPLVDKVQMAIAKTHAAKQ